MAQWTRRRFLLAGAATAGALVVGWGALPPRQRLHATEPLRFGGDAVALNGWVVLAPDNTVTVVVPRAEMGQGIHTALPMLVAEELDMPLARVAIAAAPPDKIYANLAALRDALPFHPDDTGTAQAFARWTLAKVARELGISLTGGSSSVKDAWLPMREAGAAARGMLVAAAARAWGMAPSTIRTDNGELFHDASGRRATYGSFAAAAALESPGDVVLKEPRAFRLIGRDVPRREGRAKVDGAARFGIDARPPGMVYAALRMAPTLGGTLAGINPAGVLDMPGVLSVIDISNAANGAFGGQTGAQAGVAVVAKTFWQAKVAAEALAVRWHPGPHADLSGEAILGALRGALDGEGHHEYFSRGDVDAARAHDSGEVPGHVIRAEYSVPFLAHAAMEPVNCTAQVADGKVRLWLSTQAPSIVIGIAASVGGVAREQVELHEYLLGGGFGRRLEGDMVAQAVAVARECHGLPVQVIWTREQDIRHDVYRPAAVARLAAMLDAAGTIKSWEFTGAGGALTGQFTLRNLGVPAAGPDRTTIEGAYDMQYEIPHQRIAHAAVDSAVPLGNWRSVGHSYNAFFKESFIDEMAHAAGKDPVAFRAAMLLAYPRHAAVLAMAVRAAGTPPAGRAHGVALHQSFGTIVAQVAEVSVRDGAIRVHRVVCAVDCGLAVNPGHIAQQMESAVAFGLSAALGGAITIEGGAVQQSNFGDYPVLRMGQVPVVETVIVLSTEPPEGVGEPGVPPVAPAVANAVFRLTGQRLRSLPLRLA
ncbi:xanthine dehydrogenase family protein molybdopterin-binding subunit [Pseudoduganella lutea]|uniref:Xanthine dehydrogenase family protein molybdopterin-binding subunit n=1 Tax=Pseudoduganella lutea TaxID=321985 RepID=A0A4P6L652_9BURK|nr:molybdopterin cofactor-binding domain-containing protein [Pseudoduganella lutea]QBE67037.1 xanthine dehydrogenase family protein molybdopterin-binding subunit [Pseudoduganella lutea]